MSKKQSDLVTIDQLVQNGQPTFGVFNRVNEVNYLDYHSYLLSNKAVADWRKQLRINQFAFIQIAQGSYRVCVAVATLNWVTTAFCYLYNQETNEIDVVEGLQPFTRNSEFNTSTYEGCISFSSRKLDIDMNFSEDSIIVGIESTVVNLEAHIQRSYDPLAVCVQSGKKGWTFTQKEPFFTITKGVLEDVEADESVDLAGSVAMLDWSVGYMRRITNWYWSSIVGHLADGKQFGLNLATGVNESGTSENACWFDGKRYHLPPVIFRRGEDQACWYISNQLLNWSNVEIDLTFTPLNCYKKTDRFIVVDSIFEQWVGHYSGTIIVDGETMVLDKVLGLAEDHYAKW